MEEQEIGLASESIPVPRVHDSLVIEAQQQQKQNNIVSTNTNTDTVSMTVHQQQQETETSNKTGQRKPRLRKKALHAAILKQMEFYFSDANLSKDRFLSNLIKNDPYVSLSIFINFNKIKALTTETNRIAKALESSKILSLSEDNTKVCRKTPINIRENCDDFTVYVQGLPSDADHDWLISIFSQYGSVAYVSIPRYKRNKKLKGFAFVEFDSIEGAEKCLKAFQDKHCILPSHTMPEDILSITTYTNDQDTSSLSLINNKSNTITTTTNINTVNKLDDQLYSNISNKKIDGNNVSSLLVRKRSLPQITTVISEIHANNLNLNNDDNNDTNPKKIKIDESTITDEKNICINDDSKTIKEHNCDEDDDDDDDKNDDNEEKKKKKRKRKNRSSKNEHHHHHHHQEQSDIIDFGLRIMAKKEWKKLRNKYLQLQRDKMKQLKQHLLKNSNRWNVRLSSSNDKIKYDKMDTTITTTSNNTTTTMIDQDQDQEQDKNSQKQCSVPKFSFAQGLIIKIELDEPCSNPKSLKNQLKSAANSDATDIQYIDVKEGDNYVYIRCDTASAAVKLLEKYYEDKTSIILTGDEEKNYWNKMYKDREHKLMMGKKNRVKQRGRNKLLKKAEKELGKHIRFDD